MKLKENIALEKSKMLRLNFIVSYIVVPLYVIVSILLFVTFGALMEIDDEKYLLQGLLCLGAFVLVSILLLVLTQFVTKKAIDNEFGLYDFDTSKVESQEVWDFSTDEISLMFDRNGMYVNGELFYYTHLKKTVITSNHCQRIHIYLQFYLSEGQSVILNVNPITLKMLECLNIKMDNHYILEFIIENKREAFEQIYKKGVL